MNNSTRRFRYVIGKTFVRFLIVAILVIEIYPLFWMVLSSLKTTAEFVSNSMFALPAHPNFNNYIYAWTVGSVNVLFKNTVFVTSLSMFLVLVFSMPCAFAISRMHWKLSGVTFLFFRLGMFIPAFVLLLPQFLQFKSLGILNTPWALIIAFSCNISLAVFLLVGFYRFIPDELFEASVIDGCNIYRCFFNVVVPLTGNGYVSVLMLTFFAIWNNLLVSQTFVTSTSQKMLQAGLAVYLDSQTGRDWGPTFAAISIAVLPTAIIYLFLSKFILAGTVEGSVKG